MLDTSLWIAQCLLAAFFFAAGLPKLLARGLERWTGFDDLPRPLVVTIGVSEVVGAVALVLPMAADVGRWTTPLAAVGLAVVVLMASGFHIRNGEWLPATETVLWAAFTGTVAIGRWDELATGPSLSPDLLVVAMAILVPTIAANLVLLFRQTGRTETQDEQDLVSAG
jgi:uncharacterized membrane protein YphA (DoxX/SURF4 family)